MNVIGTHLGHLDNEARARRAAKNERRERRQDARDEGFTARGSARWNTRLWIMGNKDKRR